MLNKHDNENDFYRFRSKLARFSFLTRAHQSWDYLRHDRVTPGFRVACLHLGC